MAEGVIAAAIARASPPAKGGAAVGAAAAAPASLNIDLSQLKQQQAAAEDSRAVQEEVDFWVHSARSDAEAGRQTYRELEEELHRQVQQDKQDLLEGHYLRASTQSGLAAARDGNVQPSSGEPRERAASPIVSPKARRGRGGNEALQAQVRPDVQSPYSSDGEGGEYTESDTGTDYTESDRSAGGDPLELSANPKANFLFFG